MEENEHVDDLYNILYAILNDVCMEILSGDKEEKETDKELTVDNILEMVDEELAEEEEDYNETFDDFDNIDLIEETEKKESAQTEALFYFLTHKDEKYDKVFANVAKQMEHPFIQDFILYKWSIHLYKISSCINIY